MFSGGVKEIVGMKWVKVRKSIWYACVKMLLNNSLFEVKILSPSTALLIPTKTESGYTGNRKTIIKTIKIKLQQLRDEISKNKSTRKA